MDEAEVRSKIDKILDSHRKGQRDIDETVQNLNKICTTIDTALQDRVFNYLFFSVLKQQLSQEPLPKTDERVRDPSIIRVIIRAISQFGPAPRMFPQLFTYLDSENATVSKNWGDDVFPELVIAMYAQPDRLPQGTLNEIKANTVLHSAQLRRNLIVGGPIPSYVSGAANLERAIEDLEFKRFEKTLGHEASAEVADRQNLSQSSKVREQLEIYLADLDLDPSIGKAMTEARDCLNTYGVFEPKKAADLIRSSMDQMHCGIVSVLVKLTGQAFVGKNSDGARRQYMKEARFITSAEEAFFSAVYSLISQEGSHKLDAPKETILVLERTVSDYLLLLARRLSDRRSAYHHPPTP
jgi:hypothetical protein